MIQFKSSGDQTINSGNVLSIASGSITNASTYLPSTTQGVPLEVKTGGVIQWGLCSILSNTINVYPSPAGGTFTSTYAIASSTVNYMFI